MDLKITPRMEVTLRVTLISFVAYILSIAYLPNAIPPGLGYLIGIMTPCFALNLSHYVYILGAALPSVMSIITFGLIGATALLAAASVSNGLFVGVFALWALWCTSLNYGPAAGKTAAMSGILIVSAGLLSMGSWQLVQNGLSITFDFPAMEGDGYWRAAVEEFITNICNPDPIDSQACRDKIALLDPLEPEDFVIPGDSVLAGQTATLVCGDLSCTMNISGGLWIVKGYWQWKGLTNPLAVMRNFLITICWVMLLLVLERLLPPYRTIRKTYTRGMLPAAITDALAYIEANVKKGKQAVGDNEETIAANEQSAKTENNADADQSNERMIEMQKKLIDAAVQNANGGMAPLTAFEPRLLRNAFECTWPKLKNLVGSIDHLILIAIGTSIRQHFIERETDGDKAQSAKDVALLKKCSVALATEENLFAGENFDAMQANNNATAEDKDVDAAQDDEPEEQCSPKVKNIDEEKGGQQDRFSFFTRRMEVITKELRNNASVWLDAMHNPKSNGLKDVAMTYIVWIAPVLGFFKAMFMNLLIPFLPKKWDLRTSLIGIKFVAGVVFLVIAEVYWSEYRGFAVGESREVGKDQPAGPVTITLDETPNVYSGWNLLGYIFATTPTMEGTVKKGFFRAFATAIGGFLAWIAIIVCAGTYDNSAPVNPYGLIAWLTVTTGIIAYFFIPTGPKAYTGMAPGGASLGMYTVMTQSLCALEIYVGKASRDVIVANRIVATVSGVVMAMIIAMIPPQQRGSDVENMKGLMKLMPRYFETGLSLMKEQGDDFKEKLEVLKKDMLSKGNVQKKKVEFLLKDAAKNDWFCYFKVDPRLLKELDAISVTGAYIYMWLEFARHVADDESVTLNDEENVRFKEEIAKIVERLENSKSGRMSSTDMAGEGDGPQMIGTEKEEPDLLLGVARFICVEIERQQSYFASLN